MVRRSTSLGHVARIAGVLSLPFSTASASELHVPADYTTLQAAMDAAGTGDTVVVADGVYSGPGNRDLSFSGKAFTLRSANGPAACIVDLEHLGRGLTFTTEGPGSVVRGITWWRGGFGSHLEGGALRCSMTSAPTFVDCAFVESIGHLGGAAWIGDDSFPTFEGCLFTGGTATYGAAISVWDHAKITLRRCTLVDNSAAYIGGGVHWGYDPFGVAHTGSLVADCIIARNSAGQWGGGLSLLAVDLPVRGCTIVGNSAYWGGGIACLGSGWGVNPPATLLDLTDSVLWDNDADRGGELAVFTTKFGESIATVGYCDIQDRLTGGVFVDVEYGSSLTWLAGNFDLDPLFVGPASGDYHLALGSPCIDAGDPTYKPLPGELDIDGEPRAYGLTPVDVGSDEVHLTTTAR